MSVYRSQSKSNPMINNDVINGVPASGREDNELNEAEAINMDPKFDSPLREDAFELSEDEKIELIAERFQEIMQIIGLDLTDDSLQDTPKRVAKMYVEEIFSGLNPENKPSIALFENKYAYNEMLVEKNITLFSNCEHHFVPIIGKAHIGYISSGKVIGLSKLNRVVQYFSKRPQVQERLTNQIAKELQDILGTEDVAVIIDAEHLCVSSRGVQDVNSATVTSFYGVPEEIVGKLTHGWEFKIMRDAVAYRKLMASKDKVVEKTKGARPMVKPGAKRISTVSSRSHLLSTSFMNEDGSIATVVMNETDQDINYKMYIGMKGLEQFIPAHSIQTIVY